MNIYYLLDIEIWLDFVGESQKAQDNFLKYSIASILSGK